MKNITLLFLFLFSLNLSSQSESKDEFEKLKPSELRIVNSDQVEKCDSIITISTEDGITTPAQKTVYGYDNRGNIISQIQYKWDSQIKQWLSRSKIEQAFNTNRHQTFIATYTWNEKTNTWADGQKKIFTYDSNDEYILEITTLYWDSAINSWTESYKTKHEFNEKDELISVLVLRKDNEVWCNYTKIDYQYYNGNKTSEIEYTRSVASDSWMEYRKLIQKYNSSGTLRSKEKYGRDGRTQLILKTEEEKYDETGKLLLSTTYAWNQYDEVLYEAAKEEYQYDEQGYNIQKLSYKWYSDIVTLEGYQKVDSLILISKEEYQYDSRGEYLLKMVYVWSFDENKWYESYKQERQYGNNGKIILDAEYQSNIGEPLENYKKMEYQYNDEGRLASRKESYGNDDIWYNLRKTDYQYNDNNSKWIRYVWNAGANLWIPELIYETVKREDNQTAYIKDGSYYNGILSFERLQTYYYSLKDVNSVNENQKENLNVKLYPNPVTDGFYVQGLIDKAQLVLTDLNGRVLLNQPVENNNFINISPLPQGIYLVKIRGAQDNLDQKIIKK